MKTETDPEWNLLVVMHNIILRHSFFVYIMHISCSIKFQRKFNTESKIMKCS